MDNDSVEIVGLGDAPVTVDADLNVSAAAPAEAQDVMAEMRAAVGADAPAVADKPAETPEAKTEDDPEAEVDEAPVAADDAPDTDAEEPGDKPADEPGEAKTGEDDEGDETDADPEDAPEEDGDPEAQTEEEKQPEAAAEPSETEKLVEELGGVEVLKAAQPFVESVYDLSLPVSERVSRLEALMPEKQMAEMRHEIFWQAAEDEKIQQMLTADTEAREIFAQQVFGVPFGFLENVFSESKTFQSEEEFQESVAEYRANNPAPAKTETRQELPAKPAGAKTEKPEAKTEEKPAAPAQISPALSSILDDLNNDVEKVLATGQLDPADTDDATVKQLKADAQLAFEKDWTTRFLADKDAMKAYQTVKNLADQGSEKQARQRYASLTAHAQRIAADLLAEVSKPLAEHRANTQKNAQKKVKAAAATAKPKTVAEKPAPAKPAVDVSALKSDDDITRAMEESMARHSS